MFTLKAKRKKLPYQTIGVGIVLNDLSQVLIDQRLNEGFCAGMWEFPGGKQKVGEDIRQTIVRELREELAIEIKVGKRLVAFDHNYSHKNLHFVVHMCELIEGDPIPLASQQVKWVLPKTLGNYPFPAANAKIITSLLEDLNEDKPFKCS